MIDLHSHVLPCMDDGSSSVEESLQLLSLLQGQGVDTVVATPHFYARRVAPEGFLERRSKAACRLRTYLSSTFPRVLLGAEVLYYPGISRTEKLDQLTLGTSSLLLLEMPVHPWDASMVQEVFSLSENAHLTVVLAHIDRYLLSQKPTVWEDLHRHGVKFQVNAEALLHWRMRRCLLRMLQEEKVQFIASDCHNLVQRPPKLDLAYQVISKKLGPEMLDWLDAVSRKEFPIREVDAC